MRKEIESVAVYGAGAVGAYIIQGLYEKFGKSFSVVAKGERREKLIDEGLLINGRHYRLNVRTPKEVKGVHLLIVCLKYNALRPALEDIAEIVTEDTLIMSLMNGVDSEDIIGEKVGFRHLVWSMIKIASHRIGNDIRFDLPEGQAGIYIGEPSVKAENSGKVETVYEALSHTTLCLHKSDNIIEDIWNKFALNVCLNIPQAILGIGVGAYEDSRNCAALVRLLSQEVSAVAKAKGISVANVRMPAGYLKPQRYSTLQDIDAGRKTEIDMFCGAIMRMGKELGIPTPYSACMYYLIKALEEKNEGKFDYKSLAPLE